MVSVYINQWVYWSVQIFWLNFVNRWMMMITRNVFSHQFWSPLAFDSSNGDFLFFYSLTLIWISFCLIHLDTFNSYSILFVKKKRFFGILTIKQKNDFMTKRKFHNQQIINKDGAVIFKLSANSSYCQMLKHTLAHTSG